MYGQNSEASKDVTRIVFQLLKGQSYEKKLLKVEVVDIY